MSSSSPTPPLPKEPRHQRFADHVLIGKPLVEAYLAAGFKCSRATANANAKKLRKRPDVEAYIKAIQAQAATESALSLDEILRFCARVVRTPITKLDPRSADDSNADLIKSYTLNEGEASSSFRLEKHDPFKAIDTHLKLSGQDAETEFMKAFQQALESIGGDSVLPTDRM